MSEHHSLVWAIHSVDYQMTPFYQDALGDNSKWLSDGLKSRPLERRGTRDASHVQTRYNSPMLECAKKWKAAEHRKDSKDRMRSHEKSSDYLHSSIRDYAARRVSGSKHMAYIGFKPFRVTRIWRTDKRSSNNFSEKLTHNYARVSSECITHTC